MARKKRVAISSEGKESENALVFLLILTAVIIIIILAALFYSLVQYSKAREMRILANASSADCVPCEQKVFLLYNDTLQLKAAVALLENELNESERLNLLLQKRLNATSSISAIDFSRISRDQVQIYPDRVVLQATNVFPVKFTNSTSMYPFINQNVFALQVRPQSPDDLAVGDIIGFQSKAFNTLIIHRIVQVGYDTDGWYAVTKGDTNTQPDPGKVRFSDVQGVLIGLIY